MAPIMVATMAANLVISKVEGTVITMATTMEALIIQSMVCHLVLGLVTWKAGVMARQTYSLSYHQIEQLERKLASHSE